MKEQGAGNFELVHLIIKDGDQEDILAYSPQGSGKFDKFCQEQRRILEERRRDLEQPLGRKIGHRHGFRSLPEMSQILAQRKREVERIGIIISALEGRNEHILRYVRDDEGNIVGFDLG